MDNKENESQVTETIKNRRAYILSPTNLLFRTLDRDVDFSDVKVIDFKKKITLRVVITAMVATIIGIFLLFRTPIGKGGVWTIAFIFSYAWAIYITSFRTPTGDFKYSYIPVIPRYFNKHARNISTRSVASLYSLEKLFNLEDQDFSDGYLHFKDGEIGELVEVTGMASRLMFLEDQDVVINDVISFYRAINDQCTIIFDTVSSPQRVASQVAYTDEQLANLNPIFKDGPLEDLLKRQRNVLTDFVGKRFETIRQYMIIKSRSEEELYRIEDILNNQIMNTAFLKTGRIVDEPEEIKEYFKNFYGMDLVNED
ncbi:hypothetical protein [Ligilactobacillus equi]|uniref:Uncharacterized protein n=1 Tax=Ligilactobacillus equi DSM 15833 = JCM 10991 TaxID=1423740 RepID=A0A0R1TSL0_9LACO|nr:hypothetical protein [Ligilactobacillus equi]KRL84348.1 hypothetical protein FC36_GL000271 [Ligilactobacillus equi DSM 15833 = JCM 10991]